VSNTFAPGEKVRVNPEVNKGAVAALAEFANNNDGIVEVEAVLVVDNYIKYRVKGLEGLQGGNALTDVRNHEHCYGVLFQHDNELWAVDLEDSSRVFRIQGDPEVHVRYNLGTNTYQELTDLIVEMKGASGEFNVMDNGDAGWSLCGVPWYAGADPEELQKAVASVEAYKESHPSMGM
jgi:hypothetical protein